MCDESLLIEQIVSSQAVCSTSVAGFLGMDSGQFGPDRLRCGGGLPTVGGARAVLALTPQCQEHAPRWKSQKCLWMLPKTFSPEATSHLEEHPGSAQRGLG